MYGLLWNTTKPTVYDQTISTRTLFWLRSFSNLYFIYCFTVLCCYCFFCQLKQAYSVPCVEYDDCRVLDLQMIKLPISTPVKQQTTGWVSCCSNCTSWVQIEFKFEQDYLLVFNRNLFCSEVECNLNKPFVCRLKTSIKRNRIKKRLKQPHKISFYCNQEIKLPFKKFE